MSLFYAARRTCARVLDDYALLFLFGCVCFTLGMLTMTTVLLALAP